MSESPAVGLDRVGGRLGRVVLLLAAREHLDRGRDDLGLPVAQALVVVPGPGLEAALDRDLLALAEVAPAHLGQAVPGDDVVELARSLPLPAYSVVATLNCVTCLPLASARISGSRVRRPARRTLFTVHRSFFGRPTGHGPTLRAAEPPPLGTSAHLLGHLGA
jgi:hypothetical protein